MSKLVAEQKTYISGVIHGKAHRVVMSHVSNVLLPYNLSAPEWKLLGMLAENGGVKLAKLAELLGVEAPLVTSLVDSLEKKNLVRRKNDPQDKRAKIIEATKKALIMLEDIEPKILAKAGILFDGVSQDDLRTYLRVLDTIVKNG